jgi:TRAP transporter TAXI family solute receptor
MTGVCALTLAGAVAFTALPGAAQDREGWPSSIMVGTASQGGTFFIYGAGWAGMIQEMLGVPASSEVTGGPVQNLALTQSNDVQMAMTTMGPAREAWDGISPIMPGVEMRDIRATFPMYQTPFHGAALASSGITSISDLDGKTVGNGPRGGTCGTYWPLFYDALGVETNDQFGGASDQAGQLTDGLIDAFSFCAGLPIAAYSELEAQQNINFYAFTPEEQAILVDQFPVSAYEIPAGTYTTQTEPMHSVSMWNFGIAHKDLPQSFVYEVMKVVLDNHDRMMQIHQASVETLPENWVHNTFLPFHAGAVQYYKEKGFDIPAELIPEEYQE